MAGGSGDLEARLGYRFRERGLLDQALTPPSSGLLPHNQRLEFLGDALLNAAIALLIHREKPEWSEGDMSKLRASLVSTASLAAWARGLDLRLTPGPRSPKGPPGGKALADAVEAILAAVHEDAGEDGFTVVARLCAARFSGVIRSAREDDWRKLDAKTALQEQAAALGLEAPRYRLVEQAGPGHAPVFTMEVTVGAVHASGRGPTRKAAEAEAAGLLLRELESGRAG